MTQEDKHVYTVLGELSADVKHILSALQKNQEYTEKLRNDCDENYATLSKRLANVEKFNTKVAAYWGVAMLLFIPVVNYLVPFLIALL